MRFSGRMRGCRFDKSRACRPRPTRVAQHKETTMARDGERARDALAGDSDRDVFALLPSHFPGATLETWRAAFEPLFKPHADAAQGQGGRGHSGPGRDFVTVRFARECA